MSRLVAILIVAGLLAVAGFFAWASYAMHGDWTGGSRAIATAMAIGVIGVGALTGALMWLAFYSARAGYDEPARLDMSEPEPGEQPENPDGP